MVGMMYGVEFEVMRMPAFPDLGLSSDKLEFS